MSIHQTVPDKWVPLSDEIFDSLYAEYCSWMTLPPEDRAHLVALRQWEDERDALAKTNPPEHQAWRAAIDEWDALYGVLSDELGPRMREGRPAFNDDQC